MPKSVYIFIFNQRFLNEYFVDNVLDKQDLICLQRMKWFQFIIFVGIILSLRTSSILTFSNKSVKLFILKSCLLMKAKTLHSENVFNGARRLTRQTLWLLFLFQYEKVSKLCMTNSQSGYFDLFSSWFSKSWSPFFQSGLGLEEFIVDVIIPALLPFCVKEFIDFGFQVSIWNPEYVGSRFQADLAAESALSFPLTPMHLEIQHIIISLLFDIESSQLNSFIIRGFSGGYCLMIVRPRVSLRIWWISYVNYSIWCRELGLLPGLQLWRWSFPLEELSWKSFYLKQLREPFCHCPWSYP